MSAGCRWLRPDVDLRVGWRDDTRAGTPVTDRPDRQARDAFAPVLDALAAGTSPGQVDEALLAAATSAAFADLAEVERDGAGGVAAWRLHDDVCFPDPHAAPPATLTFGRPDGAGAEVALTAEHWGPVHTALAALSGPGLAVPTSAPARGPEADVVTLVRGLEQQGWLTDEAPEVALSPGPATTFVGHNAVAVRDGGTQVLVDPFLRPRSAAWPDGYQPLGPAELGRVDAILITHGHPDHVDPGSLLRFDPQVPVVVPAVDAENLLSPDLVVRLTQLGFTDVRPRRWGDVERIGDLEVHVLPFLGEQPTEGERLHPDVRMVGNTYVVRGPELSVAVTADAGRDDLGDTAGAAAGHRQVHGPVDVVYSGYRGWVAYPAQHLRSSVARYAWFVPPAAWGTRQQIMCDPAGAVTVAEAFGATRLVPCAAGGAPWFWELGLGPRLGDEVVERPGFDPAPERVAEAAACRVIGRDGEPIASPVDVAVLRPGDSLAADGRVQRTPGHAWPW